MNLLHSLFPNPETSFPLIAVILALPAIGAFVNGVFGKRLGPQAVKTMALAAVFGSFAASVAAFLLLVSHTSSVGESHEHIKFVWNAWRWLSIENTPIDVAFSIDALSGVMMLVVTGVGGLIHLYATSYMEGDPGYHRFFAYLNLFILAMMVLILGDSLPILFVGWEGVGLCSYLLIGFWFEENKNAAAGKKAFITNRIGDFGLLVAMAMLLNYTGSLSFSGIEAHAGELITPVQIWPIGAGLPKVLSFLNGPVHVSGATLVGLALFLGCAGKSAQIPLYVWLPDAMAGPTPVSALIHAATMVTAGVYLVARMNFVFLLSPTAMMVVAGVGALTAVFAATIGIVQNDIKKVLAYSTVSQLGYMFIGVGVGAFSAGIFHVFTHAFFKACLFLGAGSVIHAMHARIHDTDKMQDMRHMGGLRKYMPYTFWTYVAATAAIVGTPFTAGFFSKDEIMLRAWVNRIPASPPLQDMVASQAIRDAARKATQVLAPDQMEAIRKAAIQSLEIPGWFSQTIFVLAVLGAVMTAFYMTRTVVLTFMGDFRGWRIVPGWKDPHAGHGHDHHDDHGHGDEPMDGPVPHESPWPMTLPLVVLASFAIFAGLLNAPLFKIEVMRHWIDRAVGYERIEHAVKTVAEEGTPAFAHLEHMLLIPGVLAFLIGVGGAWYIYEVKKGEPARQMMASAAPLHRLVYDKWRIDELYEATVISALDALAETSALFDKYVVDGVLAKLTAIVIQSFGHLFRLFQTGRVQMYAATMVVGLLATGAFLVVPHAELVVQAEQSSGAYVLQASPGLGYEFRWDRDGNGEWDDGGKWTLMEKAQVNLAPGNTQVVRLEVKNVFGLTAVRELHLTRPLIDKSGPDEVGMVAPGGAPKEVAR